MASRVSYPGILLIAMTLLLTNCGSPAKQPLPYPLWNGVETVDAYARRAQLPPTRELDLGGGVKMEFVLIPAGECVLGKEGPAKPKITYLSAWILLAVSGFVTVVLLAVLAVGSIKRRRLSFSLAWLILMTASCGLAVGGLVRWRQARLEMERCTAENRIYFADHDEVLPASRTLIAKPIYMSKYPVTQAEFETVVGRNYGWFKGARNPVERVTWYNARDFCRDLRGWIEKNSGEKIKLSLPTEAQWEYACRAGTRTRFYSGDADADLGNAGWYLANSGEHTHPVGEKKPNAFGLYDMHGNVSQWCDDLYNEAVNRGDRVSRGGNGSSPAEMCESARRSNDGHDTHHKFVGIRLVLEIPDAKGP